MHKALITTMSKVEMKEVLARLGWSQAELGRRIGVRAPSISRWKKVPGAAAAYLRLVVTIKESC